MRSRPFLSILWVVGTLVAVGLVWQSLGFVSNKTEDGEVGRSLAAAGPAISTPAALDPSSGSALPPGQSSVSSLPTPPTADAGPGGGSDDSTEPGDDDHHGDGATTTTPAVTGSTRTTAPASSSGGSTTTSAPRSTAGAGVPADAVDQTLVLTGGTAMVRYSASGVEVLWATPADGYTVSIEPEGDGATQVDFRSGHQRWRLTVWWSGGPQHQIENNSSGGGGDGEH